MKKIYTLLLVAIGAMGTMNAQTVSVNGGVSTGISKTNGFIDASLFAPSVSTGKGIGFPSTDLSKFVLDKTKISQSTYSSAYDGFMVYNTYTGNFTQPNGDKVFLEQGFYFFSNPGGSYLTKDISKGKWTRIFDEIKEPIAAAAVLGSNGGYACGGILGGACGGTGNLDWKIDTSLSTSFDPHGLFDATKKAFVIKDDGIYTIYAQISAVSVQSLSLGTIALTYQIEVNGNDKVEFKIPIGSLDVGHQSTGTGTRTLKLKKGDVVTLTNEVGFVTTTGLATGVLTKDSDETFFQITKL